MGAPYALERIRDHKLTREQGQGTSVVVFRDISQPEEICPADAERFGGDVGDPDVEANATKKLVSEMSAAGTDIHVFELELPGERGEDGWTDHNLAIATASGNPGPVHFAVGELDTATLTEMLVQRIRSATPCEVELNGKVASGQDCSGRIELNGTKLGCNEPNGFRVRSPSVIELLGSACKTVQETAQSKVSADFPCETFKLY